jgi:hypothetical protein
MLLFSGGSSEVHIKRADAFIIGLSMQQMPCINNNGCYGLVQYIRSFGGLPVPYCFSKYQVTAGMFSLAGT